MMSHNEFSAMAANSSSMLNNFEGLFAMRGFSQQGVCDAPLQSLHVNQAQSLSLSLYNTNQQASHMQSFHLKNCKFLLPTQELLNEFCSLGEGNSFKRDGFGSSWSQHNLCSLEPVELQKRKIKLFSMLEEVDRRYKRYCEQMKSVVSTFETIAGEGAATSYSRLASKAMSRHFRCLRDSITGQLKATRQALGDRDETEGTGGRMTRGDTPRLKLLDQSFRQQKAFQQNGIMMETHPWRPQRGLPDRSVSILRAWLFEHFLHPYPSDIDKHILARQTGLSRSQVSNWFINARVRLWKPMIEEIYNEELKMEDKNSQSSHATTMQEPNNNNNNPYSNPNPSTSSQPLFEDRKPKTCHLQLDEQNSLSSIINNINTHHDHNPNPNLNQNFGILETDFGLYHGHELTLSLQQHERPLLFERELPIGDEGDEEQFSMLQGESQNIPYRNLMGAQLLHDFAG